ncbi:MAG: hypothetical protein HC805_00490 [Alkalinema sp. RL_2_19]|nr:hypothetical protein [Alkalinema sp. RL_2_19]
MAVSRKSKAKITTDGSTTPAKKPKRPRGRPKKENKQAEVGVKLRVPESLLEEIDAAVAERQPAPSRHQWILEAIYEKLDREAEA